MSAANYANPGISNAANPSQFGYHHGPIPNPNPGWVPDEVREQHDNGRAYTVSAEMNARAPNPGSKLASINTGVCDVVVNTDTNTMCGTVCASQPALRRHIRTAHPGAVENRPRTNTSIAEESAGKQAIQNFVRSGTWRDADYVREPGVGPEGGLVHVYADAMEELARTDANFAATYGMRFHRPRGGSAPPSSRKRKNRGGAPREDTPESPTPAPRPSKKKAPTPRKAKAHVAASSRQTRSQNKSKTMQEEIVFKADQDGI